MSCYICQNELGSEGDTKIDRLLQNRNSNCYITGYRWWNQHNGHRMDRTILSV